MGSFLNSAMAGATSRFITFELGRGNREKLQNIFSTALIIHFFIALFVVLLAETIGLWFLNNKMNIPEGRMFAANVLYQFSVASVIVGFTQVPYAADIIAHEKMSIYAYFEIINVVLKLIIVYCLLLVNTDRLIFYAGLVFAVSILSALFYRWYCITHFKEARFTTHFDKDTARLMLTFSGFDFYGNMCVVAKNQGEPIILNLFFGVVANAGSTIALTVSGAINSLTTTVAKAFRPQIIKQYAEGDIQQMASIMRKSIQFTLLAFSIIAMPFLMEPHSIIYLWLGQVPPYAVPFLRLIIVLAIIDITIVCNNTAIHATGDIKYISFINGSLYLASPIVSYLILKFYGGPATTIYIVGICQMLLVALIGLRIINAQIKLFPIFKYCISIARSFLSIGISVLTVYFIFYGLGLNITPSGIFIIDSITRCIMIFFVAAVILFITFYIIALNNDERRMCWGIFDRLIHKKH